MKHKRFRVSCDGWGNEPAFRACILLRELKAEPTNQSLLHVSTEPPIDKDLVQYDVKCSELLLGSINMSWRQMGEKHFMVDVYVTAAEIESGRPIDVRHLIRLGVGEIVLADDE